MCRTQFCLNLANQEDCDPKWFVVTMMNVLNEDWIKCRMVRSHRLLSLVLAAIGVGRQSR
jgi:hypothetical protein